MPDFVLHRTDHVGYDIVLAVGQSNMDGRATDFDASRIDISDPRVYQFGNPSGPGPTYANLISLATEPLLGWQQTAMGPALRWARSYAHTTPTNRRILIVPAAKGGTPFEGASSPSGWTWKVGRSDVANLYTAAVTQASAAYAAAEAQYPGKNRIVAILWLQGESDGDNATSGPTYQTDLDALITQFRTDLAPYATPALPFVIGGMVTDYLSSGTRAAINAVHIDTPRRLLSTGFGYGVAGLNLGDGNHYNAAGQRAVSDRMFAAYLRAKGNVLGTVPVVPAAPTLTQSGSTVTASWAQPTGRVTDYNLRYSTNAGTSWTTLTRAQSIDVSAAITGVTQPSSLVVQVRTVNEQGASAWSASGTLAVVAAPGQVTGLTAGTATAYTVPLTWTAVTGATTYTIQASTDGNTWANVGTAGTGATAGSASGLSPSTAYSLRVTASNAGGSATPSATVSATTPVAPALLDSITGTAFAAYSVTRKMKNAYGGSAIQVRRSSDNTTQDIGFTSGGLLDTATLLTFCGAGDGFIAKIYDQTGGTNHLVQATNALQQKIVTAGALITSSSIPMPVFDGTSMFYGVTGGLGLYTAAAASLVAVVKGTAQQDKRVFAETETTNGSAQYGLGSTSSSGGSTGSQFVVKNEANVSTGFINRTIPTFDGTLHQLTVTDSGSSSSSYVDGTQDGTALAYTRSGTLAPNFATVGALVRSGTAAAWFAGSIPEILVFKSVLSSTDIGVIRANQKAYYGTP